MARDPKYDVLFEPLVIGSKLLPNRFWQTPYGISATSETPGTSAALRGVRAEGGWGAVHIDYTSIAPEDDQTPGRVPTLWDDDDTYSLSLVAAEIHTHGALAGIELGFAGALGPMLDSRIVPRGPSQVAMESLDGWLTSSYEASERDIAELLGMYATAAVRARDAGFDIVYLYGGAGFGPSQFLSPYFNKRTDRYGGSLENRARFWREALEALRGAVGSDCAIVTRLSTDDLQGSAGVPLKDMLRVIEWLDPLVDAFDFALGFTEWAESIAPSRFYPENSAREWTLAARAAATKPVIGNGRFTSPDTMLAAITDGQVDIIGAARPSIADPFLPTKIREGRADEICECIGCNACIGSFSAGAPRILCTVNATTGEEFRRGWHPERFTRATNADNDVLVVGGGPAGLECAMVLGKRGMRRVRLVDAAPEIGGVLRWIPSLPRLGEWGRMLDYRRKQLDRLTNVEIVTDAPIDAAGALASQAAYIVVATGAKFAADGTNFATHSAIPGADASLAHCLTPEQILLEGKDVPGRTVAVVDYDGYLAGLGLAELLRSRGHEVVYITPFEHPAAYSRFTGEAPSVRRLMHVLGIRVLSRTHVRSIRPGEVTTYDPFSESLRRFPGEQGTVREAIGADETVEADAVVLVTDRRSDTALYRGLVDAEERWPEVGVEGVYRIGDCVAPRQLSEAVFDGHRLAREFDSPNPAVALPWRREPRAAGIAGDAQVLGLSAR